MTEVSSGSTDSRLLDGLTAIAARAAAVILAIAPAALKTREKPDRSPVTAADEASERVILDGLRHLMPGVPVVSEESTGHIAPTHLGSRFVVVDPLDGTREFLAGRDEFTVNIALLDAGQPRLGVVAAPALGLLWRGIVGIGAERLTMTPDEATLIASDPKPIGTRIRPRKGAIAIVSRSHLDPETEAYLERLQPAEKIQCGSALKFCRLAEGAADVYPRLSPTSEWDVGAGHALLVSAGGNVTAPNGEPLRYGQAGYRIPGFIAWGDRTATGVS
jgi:3'(2'), 5'-bisphosphate nucleotidase